MADWPGTVEDLIWADLDGELDMGGEDEVEGIPISAKGDD